MTAPPIRPPTQPSIFGRIVSTVDIEGWVLTTLRTWSSTYIGEMERQYGLAAGTLPRIRAWRTAPSMDKWPEDQLPCVVVQALGTSELPLMGGDGAYTGRFIINTAMIAT